MGWKDAPVVELDRTPAWAKAPLLDDELSSPQRPLPSRGLRRQSDVIQQPQPSAELPAGPQQGPSQQPPAQPAKRRVKFQGAIYNFQADWDDAKIGKWFEQRLATQRQAGPVATPQPIATPVAPPPVTPQPQATSPALSSTAATPEQSSDTGLVWGPYGPMPRSPVSPVAAETQDQGELGWIDSMTARRIWGDVPVTAAKAVVALPQAATGLVDLGINATRDITNPIGAVYRMAKGQGQSGWLGWMQEKIGIRYDQAQKVLDEAYSPEQKKANAAISESKGILGKIGAALTNPSVVANSVLESIPQMLAGGAIGKVAGLTPSLGKYGYAVGEGLISAGSGAEQTRSETKGGLLTDKQTAIHAASGALTGALSVLGGKVASKLGIDDIDMLLSGGSSQATKGSVLLKAVAGALTEGGLEETPQSVQEKIASNLANGRKWHEGWDDAAVMGALSGGVMGAGAQGYGGIRGKKQDVATPGIFSPQYVSAWVKAHPEGAVEVATVDSPSRSQWTTGKDNWEKKYDLPHVKEQGNRKQFADLVRGELAQPGGIQSDEEVGGVPRDAGVLVTDKQGDTTTVPPGGQTGTPVVGTPATPVVPPPGTKQTPQQPQGPSGSEKPYWEMSPDERWAQVAGAIFKERARPLAEVAEKDGTADKIEELSAQRKTSSEIKAILGLPSLTVEAVRVQRGIPKWTEGFQVQGVQMGEAAQSQEFTDWLAARQVRQAATGSPATPAVPPVAENPAAVEPEGQAGEGGVAFRGVKGFRHITFDQGANQYKIEEVAEPGSRIVYLDPSTGLVYSGDTHGDIAQAVKVNEKRNLPSPDGIVDGFYVDGQFVDRSQERNPVDFSALAQSAALGTPLAADAPVVPPTEPDAAVDNPDAAAAPEPDVDVDSLFEEAFTKQGKPAVEAAAPDLNEANRKFYETNLPTAKQKQTIIEDVAVAGVQIGLAPEQIVADLVQNGVAELDATDGVAFAVRQQTGKVWIRSPSEKPKNKGPKDASAVRSPEAKVQQEQGGPDIRGPGQVEVPAERAGQVAPARGEGEAEVPVAKPKKPRKSKGKPVSAPVAPPADEDEVVRTEAERDAAFYREKIEGQLRRQGILFSEDDVRREAEKYQMPEGDDRTYWDVIQGKPAPVAPEAAPPVEAKPETLAEIRTRHKAERDALEAEFDAATKRMSGEKSRAKTKAKRDALDAEFVDAKESHRGKVQELLSKHRHETSASPEYQEQERATGERARQMRAESDASDKRRAEETDQADWQKVQVTGGVDAAREQLNAELKAEQTRLKRVGQKNKAGVDSRIRRIEGNIARLDALAAKFAQPSPKPAEDPAPAIDLKVLKSGSLAGSKERDRLGLPQETMPAMAVLERGPATPSRVMAEMRSANERLGTSAYDSYGASQNSIRALDRLAELGIVEKSGENDWNYNQQKFKSEAIYRIKDTMKPAEAPAKQPWEMTRAEFAANQGGDSPYVQQQRDAIVKQAIKRGDPVPADVLSDYPDLQPKPTAKSRGLKPTVVSPRGQTALPGLEKEAAGAETRMTPKTPRTREEIENAIEKLQADRDAWDEGEQGDLNELDIKEIDARLDELNARLAEYENAPEVEASALKPTMAFMRTAAARDAELAKQAQGIGKQIADLESQKPESVHGKRGWKKPAMEKRNRLDGEINELRKQVQAINTERDSLWANHDVERYDFDTFVSQGRELPPDRAELYADYEATKPAVAPAEEAPKPTPAIDEAAMLRIRQTSDRFEEAAKKVSGGKGLAVGSAGTSDWINADALRTFLRRIRAGDSPTVAGEAAKADAREMVAKHNAKRKDINWQRSEMTADAAIEDAVRMLTPEAAKPAVAATPALKKGDVVSWDKQEAEVVIPDLGSAGWEPGVSRIKYTTGPKKGTFQDVKAEWMTPLNPEETVAGKAAAEGARVASEKAAKDKAVHDGLVADVADKIRGAVKGGLNLDAATTKAKKALLNAVALTTDVRRESILQEAIDIVKAERKSPAAATPEVYTGDLIRFKTEGGGREVEGSVESIVDVDGSIYVTAFGAKSSIRIRPEQVVAVTKGGWKRDRVERAAAEEANRKANGVQTWEERRADDLAAKQAVETAPATPDVVIGSKSGAEHKDLAQRILQREQDKGRPAWFDGSSFYLSDGKYTIIDRGKGESQKTIAQMHNLSEYGMFLHFDPSEYIAYNRAAVERKAELDAAEKVKADERAAKEAEQRAITEKWNATDAAARQAISEESRKIKGKKQDVEMTLANDEKETIKGATVYGNFAVHKTDDKVDPWRLTHIPSGMGAGTFPTKGQAVEATWLLQQGLDWNKKKSSDELIRQGGRRLAWFRFGSRDVGIPEFLGGEPVAKATAEALPTNKGRGKKPAAVGDTVKTYEHGDVEILEVIHKNWGLGKINGQWAAVNLRTGTVDPQMSHDKTRIIDRFALAGISQPDEEPDAPSSNKAKAAAAHAELAAEIDKAAAIILNPRVPLGLDPNLIPAFIRVAKATVKAKSYDFRVFIENVVADVELGRQVALDCAQQLREVWEEVRAKFPKLSPSSDVAEILAEKPPEAAPVEPAAVEPAAPPADESAADEPAAEEPAAETPPPRKPSPTGDSDKTTGTKNAKATPDAGPARRGGPNASIPVSPTPVGKTPSTGEVVRQISQNFGVPVRTGHFAGPHAGIYKQMEDVARTKGYGSIAVASHEVAHHLDRTGGVLTNWRAVPAAARDELKLLDYQPSRGDIHEGFAEYVRHRLTMDDAAMVAPEFDAWFNTWLNGHPEAEDAFYTSKLAVDQWRQAGSLARVEAQIDMGESLWQKVGKGLRNPIGVIRTVKDWINDNWINRLAPLLRVSKQMVGASTSRQVMQKMAGDYNFWAFAKVSNMAAASKARAWAEAGVADVAGNRLGPGLRETLAPIAKELRDKTTLRQFYAYCYSRHALDVLAEGKEPGILKGDAQNVVAQFDSQPGWKDAADGITAWHSALVDYLVEAGGLSQDVADTMRAMYPHYISLARKMDSEFAQGAGGGGARYANLPSGVMRLKGSGREIQPPLESALAYAERIIGIADKVRVGRMLVEASEKYGTLGDTVEKVDPKMVPASARLESLKDQLEKAGADLSMADMDALLTIFSQDVVGDPKDNIVVLWRGGERQLYYVRDDLYRALTAYDKPFRLPAIIDQTAGRVARMIRLGATGVRAGFSLITNPLRDVQTAMMQTEYQGRNPLSIVANTIGGFVKDIAGSEVAQLWERGGGPMAQPLSIDRRFLKEAIGELTAQSPKDKVLNWASHPVDSMRSLFSLPEAAPRLAEFEAALRKLGWRPGMKVTFEQYLKAQLSAANVTVDFREGGTLAMWMNQLVPFFNASIQGQARMASAIRNRPIATTVTGLLWMTLPALALWWKQKDEEWYKKLTPMEKGRYWHVKIPGTETILRIPKPFEWGHLFASMPEAAMEAAYGQNPKAFTEALGVALDDMIPGIIPGILAAPIEVAANRDFFRNAPLVSERLQNVQPEDQHTPETSETAKMLGRITGMSPIKIEHLAAGWTGGLATDVVKGVESTVGAATHKTKRQILGGASTLPVVGRLFLSPLHDRTINDFYKKLERLEQDYGSARLGKKSSTTPAELHRFRQAAEKLSDLRTSSRLILEDKALADEQKRSVFMDIQKSMANIANGAMGTF